MEWIVFLAIVGGAFWLVAKWLDRPTTPVAAPPAPRLVPPARPIPNPVPPAPNRIRRFYRTEDGSADYGFSFEQQPGGDWRIYITQQPGYGNRSTSATTIHRLSDGGRHYICWSGRIATFEDAERIAATWADNTQTYIRTGRFASR